MPYGRVAGDMGGDAPNARKTRATCLLIMVVLTLVGAWVAAGFAIANYTTLNPSDKKLMADASASTASDVALSNAATVLMEHVQASACNNVATCPAGDLACDLCKCHAVAVAGAPGPCAVISCARSALLDSAGGCVTGAPLDKCTISQLVTTSQCA